MKHKTKNEYDFTLPVIIILGFFAFTLLLIVAVLPKRIAMESKIVATQAGQPVPYAGRSHVIALDQRVGKNVTILSASLYKPGFIVIQKMEKDIPGQVIAVSPLLQAGLYSDKVIPLNALVVRGQELYVSLYTDNGDGVFSMPDTTVSKPKDKALFDIHEPAMSSCYAL